MSGYQIEETVFDGHPALRLHAPDGGEVWIARRGATVLRITTPSADGRHEWADGYRDGADFESLKGSRFAIMVPFANRIDQARYTFEGHPYDMQPGVEASRGIRHGFVRDAMFQLLSAQADEAQARVVLAYDGIRPQRHPGYPFAIDVRVTFTLREGALDLLVEMHNVGDSAAPCFFGWHPYLRPGRQTRPDAWALSVPARYSVRVDADLLPLPGERAYVPLDDCPALDFREAAAIGSRRIDAAFAGLLPDADGCVRTRLRDPVGGGEVTMWQHSGVALVFTGDTLSRDPRSSVALEPMQAMTNAFNRDDSADTVTLAAGERRAYHCGLAWTWT